MKVYLAMYNPMMEESAFGVIGIHITKEGADKRIETHQANEQLQWDKLWEGEEPPYSFGTFEAWMVQEHDIED